MNDGFPAGSCYLKMVENPEGLTDGATVVKEKASALARKIIDPYFHAQYGMKFLLDQAENIGMT